MVGGGAITSNFIPASTPHARAHVSAINARTSQRLNCSKGSTDEVINPIPASSRRRRMVKRSSSTPTQTDRAVSPALVERRREIRAIRCVARGYRRLLHAALFYHAAWFVPQRFQRSLWDDTRAGVLEESCVKKPAVSASGRSELRVFPASFDERPAIPAAVFVCVGVEARALLPSGARREDRGSG